MTPQTGTAPIAAEIVGLIFCRKGHLAKRSNNGWNCVECSRLYANAYHQKNRAKLNARERELYAASLSKRRASSERKKKARAENPEKFKERARQEYVKYHAKVVERRKQRAASGITREYHLKRLYDMTPEQHAQMLVEQGGGCGICGKVGAKLEVDHNHQTGRVRGLLCGQCNRGIGLLCDSADQLRSAASYLEKHA